MNLHSEILSNEYITTTYHPSIAKRPPKPLHDVPPCGLNMNYTNNLKLHIFIAKCVAIYFKYRSTLRI